MTMMICVGYRYRYYAFWMEVSKHSRSPRPRSDDLAQPTHFKSAAWLLCMQHQPSSVGPGRAGIGTLNSPSSSAVLLVAERSPAATPSSSLDAATPHPPMPHVIDRSPLPSTRHAHHTRSRPDSQTDEAATMSMEEHTPSGVDDEGCKSFGSKCSVVRAHLVVCIRSQVSALGIPAGPHAICSHRSHARHTHSRVDCQCCAWCPRGSQRGLERSRHARGRRGKIARRTHRVQQQQQQQGGTMNRAY